MLSRWSPRHEAWTSRSECTFQPPLFRDKMLAVPSGCWRDRAMADDSSGNLVEQWRHGDQQAAAAFLHPYASRLIALPRNRLPAKLSAPVDPEDVVQSVYRSFFARARSGRYDLQRGGDLWRLLMTIPLHKLYKQIRR